jgi:hypothetical protein
MSSVVISGDTSGAITIATPAVAGTYTNTLPQITGTLSTLDSGTLQASTSGTSITFSNIPANIRRITVMMNVVQTSGAYAPQIQLGTSGGIQTTGYLGSVSGTFGTLQLPGTGFNSYQNSTWTANSSQGIASYVLTLIDPTNNIWVCNGALGANNAGGAVSITVGSKTLSGALTQVRITMDGTVTFTAGSINILYE